MIMNILTCIVVMTFLLYIVYTFARKYLHVHVTMVLTGTLGWFVLVLWACGLVYLK
jgi:hypothetical protein